MPCRRFYSPIATLTALLNGSGFRGLALSWPASVPHRVLLFEAALHFPHIGRDSRRRRRRGRPKILRRPARRAAQLPRRPEGPVRVAEQLPREQYHIRLAGPHDVLRLDRL